MERDDLRVICRAAFCEQVHGVTDADLASLGYIKLPACEPCMGTGGTRVPCMRCKNGEPEHSHQCPSCDGTGFGRLIDAAAAFEAMSANQEMGRRLTALDDRRTPHV